jgi:dTDP-4-dehydrorhamnose reductase
MNVKRQTTDRAIILGGESMLARYAADRWDPGFRTVPRREVDIGDLPTVRRLLQQERRDLVINMTGAANGDRRTLYETNALLPAEIARLCAELDKTLIYISSGRVFDGTKRIPYEENDFPNPLDDYGLSKYLGEKLVERELEDKKYFVFRLPMVLGVRINHPEGQVVYRLLEEAKTKGEVAVSSDAIHSPIYAGDAVEMIERSLSRELPYGFYHLSGAGIVSLFVLMRHLLEALGIDAKVVPVSQSHFEGGSKMPRFQALTSRKVACGGGWEEAVEKFIADYRAVDPNWTVES